MDKIPTEYVSLAFCQTPNMIITLKLAQSAENRWNKLRCFKLLADVIEGVKFVNGEKQEIQNLESEGRMPA